MAENTKPAAEDNNEETPEVEAHSSVLDLQETAAVNERELDGSCVSVISVVLSER
ncbi:hypothetical protein ACPXCE_18375 [Streptomyces sp. DT24]|uniref:hypothetical protein n=1 Tax=unclassified Streptomyces TaxID=2593676 RepID=UPI0023B99585|nr:hypothetical protein [Streptomyces sp. AM 4-1-1]WEH32194.1 hypothetical protein PZB75_01650 [Streptomyces sp. AM 4-1-1]